MSITVPCWLAIIIGIIYAIDRLCVLITSKAFNKVWNKATLLIFYKNNPLLKENKIARKKAKQSCAARIETQEYQKKKLNKRKQNLTNKVD